MEETLKEAAKQVPALTIVVALCWLLAKSQTKIISSFLHQQSESRAEYLKSIERFHDENMEARQMSRETILANSQASDNQTNALNALTSEVKQLKDLISVTIAHMQTR